MVLRGLQNVTDLQALLGQRLERVTYLNIPDHEWRRPVPIHVVDYGIEISLDRHVTRFDWDPDSYALRVATPSRSRGLPRSESTDVSQIKPWAALIGQRVEGVEFGVGAQPCAPPFAWVVRLTFEGPSSIWIAAATHVDGTMRVVPCSDEIVVAWSEPTAHALGLARRLD